MIIRNSKNYGTALPPNKNEATGLKKNKRMADDAKLFLHNKVNMVEAENIINTFSLFSGLRLSTKTAKVMKLGSIKNEREEARLPFKIVERIKILGIVFENGEIAKELEQTWTESLEKIKRCTQLWSKRGLSVKRKIVVVKCFLVSQLLFIVQSIRIPEKKSLQI